MPSSALAGDPGAKVLAGGQSLVPLLSMRLAAPSTLVDINGLPDLDAVTVTDEGVRIGALARHSDVLASDDVRRVQPLVALALSHVAHATIRNRGTTVGSLVHADAAAEMPVVLTLLGGSVEVAGPGGTRTIPAAELYVGPLESIAGARRDRHVGVLPGAGRRAGGWRSRRWRGGTVTTRWSGVAAVAQGRFGAGGLRLGQRHSGGGGPDRSRRPMKQAKLRSSNSTRPPTSMPPPTTEHSWCGC